MPNYILTKVPVERLYLFHAILEYGEVYDKRCTSPRNYVSGYRLICPRITNLSKVSLLWEQVCLDFVVS